MGRNWNRCGRLELSLCPLIVFAGASWTLAAAFRYMWMECLWVQCQHPYSETALCSVPVWERPSFTISLELAMAFVHLPEGQAHWIQKSFSGVCIEFYLFILTKFSTWVK
jgi:hypothetical protein